MLDGSRTMVADNGDVTLKIKLLSESFSPLVPFCGDQVTSSSAAVGALQTDANRKRKEADELRAKEAEAAAFIARLSEEISAHETQLLGTRELVTRVQAEADAGIERAMIQYRRAVAEAGGIEDGDLAEIRGYPTPPDTVKLVMMAVCVLFDTPTDWRCEVWSEKGMWGSEGEVWPATQIFACCMLLLDETIH